MTYSAEALEKSLESLDTSRALKIVGLAGGLKKAVEFISAYCKAFGVPQAYLREIMPTLREASKRFYAIPRCRALSY